ncbi:MAG TPA: biopolymer transporter ExbD [Longimicrobiales bacterium]|nr:biopolymer transporter ExbD [Longimicrobiales bacterium]
MMPGMRRSSRDLRLNADINITNLVDVAFVLLIIFIITAPILQGGVEVELPKADAAPITSPDAVIVSITKDEKLFVGDVPVASIEELERVFPEVMKNKNAKFAYIKGDKDVVYGRVVQVMGALERLGIAEVGLVAEPRELQRR